MNTFLEFAEHTNENAEDLIFVLDASPSMQENDYKPSRLDGAKQAGMALLDVKTRRHQDDRVGIVKFGFSAKVVQALVTVGGNVRTIRQNLLGIRTCPATNISAGLRAAGEELEWTKEGHGKRWLRRLLPGLCDGTPQANDRVKRIILLGDGCHNTGSRRPEDVAKELKQRGVIIDVVGISGDRKASEFDERTLIEIASRNPDGTPRYRFIGDTEELIKEFETLAEHIKPL